MLRPHSWLLLGLLGAACVVPDVQVVDDDSPSTGGKASSPSGGKANSPGASPAAGSPDEGGSPGGSPGPSLGGTQGGGSGAEAGANTGPTPPTAVAFGKFCNLITVDGESITLKLSIGAGSKQVVLSAASGQCSPISGKACASIPLGTGIPVSLLDGTEPLVTYPVDIVDGAFWIFGAYTDGVNVDIVGDPVTQDVCEEGYDAPSPAGT